LYQLESRIGYVLGALLITVALLWLGINYGIPALAKRIAFSLPTATEKMLGQEALAGLDKILLEPTQLSLERQAELKVLFAGMTLSIEGARDYQIVFRASSKMGPNALALPSGIVVITDALVNLSKNNNELVAVLAHEIGHLEQRHELRRLLQGSATGVLLIAITGDLSSVASFGAWLPALLVDTKYSRSFETEADEFSFEYLKRHDIPTDSFVDIIQRIESKSGTGGHLPDYISTHPATQERILNFRSRQ
jgi:Zn-dependent protease with chaperone function